MDSAVRPTDPTEQQTWLRNDAKARAVIGLTLSDEHLEHVHDCETAANMWSVIIDLFQRKTLLNKLTTRRRFYSVKMDSSEKAIAFISRVRQLASDCKAMGVDIDDTEIAMTILCGLPDKYEHLIVAIDAATDDETLTMEFVKSRLLQEEQRILDRGNIKPGRDAALMNLKSAEESELKTPECNYCRKKGHTEQRCWQKYPHMRPNRSQQKRSGLVANSNVAPPDYEEEPESDIMICLTADSSSDSNKRASRADWIIDSGATAHICNDKSMFATLNRIDPIDINIGDKSSVHAVGRGSIKLMLSVAGRARPCILSNVVFAPKMGYNMLSVPIMSRSGHKTVFEENTCSITKCGKILAQGKLRHGLYCLLTNTDAAAQHHPLAVSLTADLNLWHRRMSHVHADGIRDMIRRGVVEGIKVDLKTDIKRCTACVYGKSTRAPIPQSGGARATNILDLVHTDVCGPFPVPSLGNSLYFVSFVDDRSRFAWVYPIQAKSDVFQTFKKWLVG